jgi:UDP-N-acetylmuramoyl-L-alanyl-D-glutamate--2,6-diaminopimelate ligase
VLGTLSGPRTTPEAPDLQRWLAARRDEGTEVVAMEVSSHALALHRVDGTHFAAAVFTNLSRDHLDFHETMESYFEAKARLFSPELSARAVVNLDDPSGRLLRDSATIETATYSLDDVDDLHVGRRGSTFGWRGQRVSLPMGGRFNVANALAAAETAVLVLGVDPETVARGLGRPPIIPGRFELVDEGQPFTVIVDYAHTPDGLDRLLEAAGEMAGRGRVHVVFGCGGDRDATKRPAMGAVAATRADAVVLTADNSRSEDTAAIIDAVQRGLRQVPDPRARDVVVEPDRRAAITRALAGAAPDDVVVLAGKGHETTQTIGDAVLPFDDREVAREVLRGASSAGGGTR